MVVNSPQKMLLILFPQKLWGMEVDMPKLRWNKRGDEWILLDVYDTVLATVERGNGGWTFEGKWFSTLDYAKRNAIFTLVARGDL